MLRAPILLAVALLLPIAGCVAVPNLFGSTLEVAVANKGDVTVPHVHLEVREEGTGREIWNETFRVDERETVVRDMSGLDGARQYLVTVSVPGSGSASANFAFDRCQRPVETVDLALAPSLPIGSPTATCP